MDDFTGVRARQYTSIREHNGVFDRCTPLPRIPSVRGMRSTVCEARSHHATLHAAVIMLSRRFSVDVPARMLTGVHTPMPYSSAGRMREFTT
jgi:hypothetical protein